MKVLRLLLPLAAILLASTTAAQAQTLSQVRGSAWAAYDVVLPYGLHVREVKAGGSFVTLEDGSIYEVRMPQRPVASSWQPGAFVVLTSIRAPVSNFDILLSHGDSDRVEGRLAGRQRPAGQE